MSNKKIYKLGLIVMVVVNIILLFILIKGPSRPERGRRHDRVQAVISEKLNLSAAQEEQYAQLAAKHAMLMRELSDEQKDAITSYLDMLKTERIDSARMKALLERHSVLETTKLTATFSHFEELKEICSEEQKANFDLVLEDIKRVLLGSGKKGPPPPRDF